jgi:hypothetical protein
LTRSGINGTPPERISNQAPVPRHPISAVKPSALATRRSCCGSQ